MTDFEREQGMGWNLGRVGIKIAAIAALGACAADGTASVPTVSTVAPAEPVYLLEDIVGANVADLDALLGEPGLSRREGAGEFRRYTLTECILIVILQINNDASPAIASVEATPKTTGDPDPDLETCLARG